MKIAIISDIHGNLAALEAFPEKTFDQLWCLGELVDYGLRPHQVIQWVRHHATAVIRGNHDQAVGFDVIHGRFFLDPSLRLRRMSEREQASFKRTKGNSHLEPQLSQGSYRHH
jgi:predicted phosphodiesterase